MGPKDLKKKNKKKNPTRSTSSTYKSTVSSSEETEIETNPDQSPILENLLAKLTSSKPNNCAEIVNLCSEMTSQINSFRAQIRTLQTSNTKLKSDFEDICSINDKLAQRVSSSERKIIKLETELNNLNQYGRRNNIEIDGIPTNIKGDELETKVVEILKEIDVSLERKGIEACHRLPSKSTVHPPRTIIRVVNRRTCEKALRNKKKLHTDQADRKKRLNIGGRLYINESLCPAYRRLHFMCKSLHQKNLINKFWVYNATVHYMTVDEEDVVRVTHESILLQEFPNFKFF